MSSDFGSLISDDFIPDLTPEAAEQRTASLQRWMLRIKSHDPVEINDSEEFHGSFDQARGRLYVLVRRTSFMTEGPNREVLWSVEAWNVKRGKWETVIQGKSKLKEGSAAW